MNLNLSPTQSEIASYGWLAFVSEAKRKEIIDKHPAVRNSWIEAVAIEVRAALKLPPSCYIEGVKRELQR